MIRATSGVWLNYATTLIFQVLFAARFGASGEASAFVIAFALGLGVGAIVTGTAQSIAVPRLLTTDGALDHNVLRFLRRMTLVAGGLLASLALAAGPIGAAIARFVDVDKADLSSALRGAAIFALLQVLAASVGGVALARGYRFLPAVTPAFPSLAGAALLVARPEPGLGELFAALSVGALVQVTCLVAAAARRVRTERTPSHELVGALAVVTALQFALLSLLPVFERIFASVDDPAGGAHWFYASRSLAIVQQLLVGGLFLATLADWSAVARRASGRLGPNVAARAGATALLLLVAACVAMVAARQFVSLAYERGNFGAADTELVTRLLLIALPGFWAEGVVIVLGLSLLAERRNPRMIVLGVAHFTIRGGAIVVLGLSFGVEGVAAAYSLGTIVALGIGTALLRGVVAIDPASLATLRRAGLVGAGTVATTLIAVGVHILPTLLRAGIVMVAFALLVHFIHPWSRQALRRA